ncbi:hypothetical protein BGZ61DRAFT_567156 [Ilyonectria robusta]|uniref:uncharacterized protein n=1 Tax=Ilyonectria robusta TaxID=1079257 RepID=UPI001E8DEFBF|nr:uncharacterized protein BGZ61DRAFT_567156 [Ilyonectria robusta]KAH8658986.1 hypothetical protein BGZ61DRAFT_567156 [Ilyonectria robusta]
MSEQLLVITGVSGHVGFRVLVEALSRGYTVRAIIRRAEQAALIEGSTPIQPFLKRLQMVVVPDLLTPGAFDGVLDSAAGVVHVASPLAISSDNLKRDVIDPAIKATLGILQSAAKVPSIKRVVITSSIATLLTWEYIISDDMTKVFTAQDTYTPSETETNFDLPIQAYGAAKALALAATKRFVEEEKPSFDVVNILPSMVIGRNDLNTKKEAVSSGTNNSVMGPLLGTKTEMPTLGVSVHVNDVARAHVDALNPSIPGNRNFICSSGGLDGTTWDDAKNIAKRCYGKSVSDGVFTLDGTAPTRPIRLDASETEKVFGWKFTGFEDQVKSVADHYLELLAAE